MKLFWKLCGDHDEYLALAYCLSWIVAAIVIAWIMSGCACYDGWGWQPCAGYVHDNHPQ